MKDLHQYLINEMNPCLNEALDLWGELANLRVGIKESFTGTRLSFYTQKYQDLALTWTTLRRKAINVDELISPDDPDALQKLGEYLNQPAFQDAVVRADNHLSSVMRDISNHLFMLRLVADFKRSGWLSFAAITIGVFSIMTAVLIQLFT